MTLDPARFVGEAAANALAQVGCGRGGGGTTTGHSAGEMTGLWAARKSGTGTKPAARASTPTMPTPPRPPATSPAPWRARGAAAMLGGTAAGFAALAIQQPYYPLERLAWAGMAAIMGAASVAFLRRRVLAQVLARGAAWLVLLPAGATAIESLLRVRWPHPGELWFAATSAGALLLARSELHSREAVREFDPVAYRRVFLGGAVASVTGSMVAAAYAALLGMFGPKAPALGLAAFGVALLASAVGVVRMRGWGVLLGAATAVAALIAAVTAGNEAMSTLLALGALPGALLAAPLLASRIRPPPAKAAPEYVPARVQRVAAEGDWLEAPPVRARVADAGVEATDATAGDALSTRAG